MSAPNAPLFAGLPRATHATSAGPCELPILYSDASLLGLIYRVPVDATRSLVDPNFEPWSILGRATVVLCFFEYRETTIGPYGEIGLGVLVKRRGASPSLVGALADLRKETDAGLYVVNLPVTTEAARAAGRELWGYPKYVAPMESRFDAEGVRFTLGGELTVSMGPSRGPQSAGLPFVLYSVARGRILRTIVDVDHRQRWGGARSAAIAVHGDGPTARTVKALRLDARKPSLAFRTDAMRSILPAGRDMGPSAPQGRTGDTRRATEVTP
jgi:acetoacetate decarboxylase